MSEMIERVAKAMEQRAKEPLGNIKSLEPVRVGSLGDAWPYLARAAIEAMREPTFEMNKAGNLMLDQSDNIAATYQAMIDEALNTTPTINQIKTAFRVALNMLSIYEPHDSRTVSDIFVALASIDAGDINKKTLDIINEKVNAQIESGASFSDLK